MGIQWCFSVLLWVVVGVFLVKSVSASVQKSASGFMTDACYISGCNCTESAKVWKIINCTFGSTQKVEFTQNSIPPTTVELCISGGAEVVFQPDAFKSVRGFSLIRIDGCKRFIIHRNSFLNLNSTSLLLQIQGCDSFNVETHAFRNSQTTISVEVSRCSYVSIKKSAFRRLQDGKFHDIAYLDLEEEAFNFEKTGILGHHGPTTTISFQNIFIPKILRDTFISSLAEINIKNAEIREIHPEAFKANQISAITIRNSSIHKIYSGAFSDRTIMIELILSKCKIQLIDNKAVMASMNSFTVEYSNITEIRSGAINITVAKVTIADNAIARFEVHSLVPRAWNYIYIENNVVKSAHNSFLDLLSNPADQYEFTFIGNDIYNAEPGSLSFLTTLKLTVKTLKFDNNFFNETCRCDMDKWAMTLLNINTNDTSFVLKTSFCNVNGLLAQCFELQEGLINMHNFTRLVCGDKKTINCEHYSGQTKILNKSSTFLNEADTSKPNSGFILAIVLGAAFIIAISATIVILLIRGSLWLKRKGYCIRFHNMHYRQDQCTPEDEGTIVPMESSDKLDVPEELTPEILQRLREQLEDPSTHDDAREMIERLYELFIMGDARQEEEAHLYEELGNLQQPQTSQQQLEKKTNECKEPFGFLKMMEERYNNTGGKLINEAAKPVLAGEYSEPTDAAVHLYSELQQSKNEFVNVHPDNLDTPILIESNTAKRNSSLKMALRPLPQKPNVLYKSQASSSNQN